MTNNENNLDMVNWPAILLHLKKQKLVPFLGAGASFSSNGAPGLPGGAKLAESLAKECDYPGKDKTDLLRVAQYYALTMGEMPLRESVNEKLSQPEFQPGEIHNILASWPIEVVLTTNFDNLMERAFIINGKNAMEAVYNRLGDQEQIEIEPTMNRPLVYKLHGSLDKPDSIILTEDHYIDFLINLIEGNPKIPDKIKNIFDTCCILFIGYGLKDWNIRVLLRYFRKNDRRSFAIQRDLATASEEDAAREWESMVLYWEKKEISVYNCDAFEFLRELDRRYQKAKADG